MADSRQLLGFPPAQSWASVDFSAPHLSVPPDSDPSLPPFFPGCPPQLVLQVLAGPVPIPQGGEGAPAEIRTLEQPSRHLATLRQEPPDVSGLSISRRRAWLSATPLPSPPLPACLPGRPVSGTLCSRLAQPGPRTLRWFPPMPLWRLVSAWTGLSSPGGQIPTSRLSSAITPKKGVVSLQAAIPSFGRLLLSERRSRFL